MDEEDVPTEKILSDTSANWTSKNPILPVGAIGIETDTYKKKLGDGTNAWNILQYIDNAGGGGAPQTPWAQDINAAGYDLSNLGMINDAAGTPVASLDPNDRYAYQAGGAIIAMDYSGGGYNPSASLSFDSDNNAYFSQNVFFGGKTYIDPTGDFASPDETSALQVKGVVNFNDPSLTYGGINITSSGDSIQIGYHAYAGGDYATAVGYYAYAGGDYATAFGNNAYAPGYGSSALGYGASATGDSSSALGYDAYAFGNSSSAFGSGAYAFGNSSSAFGSGAYAGYSNSTVIGSDQSSSGNLNDNNAQGGITLGGYNPTTNTGENWLMILPGITANTPRVLIGASTVDDGTSALQVNGDIKDADGTGATGLILYDATFSQYVRYQSVGGVLVGTPI